MQELVEVAGQLEHVSRLYKPADRSIWVLKLSTNFPLVSTKLSTRFTSFHHKNSPGKVVEKSEEVRTSVKPPPFYNFQPQSPAGQATPSNRLDEQRRRLDELVQELEEVAGNN